MNKCMELIGRALSSGPCAKFKDWRNDNVKCYERCFKIFSTILFVWSMIMIATGMSFANLSWFQQEHQAIRRAQKGFQAFIIIFSIIGMIIALLGFCIARRRTCHTGFVALFGIVVFFLGLIPLFSELTAIRLISDIDQSQIDSYCKMSPDDLKSESKFIRSIFTFAHGFDQLSESYINMYMCTDLCPCNEGVVNIPKPEKSNPFYFLFGDEFFLSGRQKYKLKKHQKALNDSFRNFEPKSQSNIPMIFTNDTNNGFWSFKECIDAKAGSALEFQYAFGKKEDPEAYKDKTEVFFHPSELEAYQMLEDEFFCSGMCQKSLFFFDQNITFGPPKETCLIRFHEYVKEKSGAFALAIMMAALCTVTLFVMHIGLYCRPPKNDEQNLDEQIEMGQHQPPRSNIYQEQQDREIS